MNPRIQNLPENQLVSTIAGMTVDVNNLKASQRVGAANLQTFLNQTVNTVDKSFSVAAFTASASFTITFTSAVEDYAITSLIYRIFIGTSTHEVHPGTTGGPTWPLIKLTQQPPSATNRRVTTWTMQLVSNDTTTETFYLKFYVQSTDNGALTF